MVIKLLSMDDVGTRAEHLSDLQELWSYALGILTAGSYHTTGEIEQTLEVEHALKLLEAHMMTQFDTTTYAKTINNLPSKAEDIKDGFKDRGNWFNRT